MRTLRIKPRALMPGDMVYSVAWNEDCEPEAGYRRLFALSEKDDGVVMCLFEGGDVVAYDKTTDTVLARIGV